MNSFKAVRAALQYEIDRQAEALLDGTKIMQETRLWDSTKLLTIIMRTKEEAHDYRYFPEPDLVPFIVDTARIEEIRKLLPELPRERKKRLVASYRLSEKEADVIIMDKKNADYFEDVVKLYNAPKIVSNWLTTEIMGEINQRNTTIDKLEFGPSKLAELLKLIDDGTISGKMAKGLFRECIETGVSPKELAAKSGLKQISGEKELDSIIDEVIEENNKPVNDYKEGKANALMFLVGQIMKRTRGKANPNVVNELLKNKLNKM